MRKKIIRLVAFMIMVVLTGAWVANGIFAVELELNCKSAVLIEANTGLVLYEANADEALPPASVTKVMTMLLVMEAIDGGVCSLDDSVQISEYAASMGGSQVFLAPGEIMTVEDLLKSVTVASANDAAVALAEFIAGSEESFVTRMNQRAEELGMVNTRFENTNGLDDTTQSHLTSARDIAIMSAELLKHPKILEYSSIWMDSIRSGEFTLTNTNRLIRFYSGANGLKTGSTSKAGFCISASALRDGMQLIAVIMAAPTRDIRNETAKKLLDYGFANYSYVSYEAGKPDDITVVGGVENSCALTYNGFGAVIAKGGGSVEQTVELPEYIEAPINDGDVVGRVVYTLGGETIGCTDIVAAASVERIGFFGLLGRMLLKYLMI